MDIEKSIKQFSKLLEGKSVALVGPSPHLEGTREGLVIDSYEIVARVNENSSAQMKEDYGSRTDLLFFNFAPGTLVELEGIIAANQTPMTVVCPRQLSEISEEFFPLEEFVERFSGQTDFLFLPVDSIQNSNEQLPIFPTTGFLAMYLINKFHSGKVFFCGFSFYTGLRTYNSAVRTHRANYGQASMHVSGHPVKDEVVYLRGMEWSEGISLDPVLAGIIARASQYRRNPVIFAIQILRNSFRGVWRKLKKVFSTNLRFFKSKE